MYYRNDESFWVEDDFGFPFCSAKPFLPHGEVKKTVKLPLFFT